MSRRRRAKTLLEAVIIITLLSLVLTLSATSLTTLFRLRHQLTRDREQGMALDRLAARLRLDAHEATSVAISNGCVFKIPDSRTIRYEVSAPNIIREVRGDSKVLHRDRFVLPRAAAALFELDSTSPRVLVRLTIRPIEVPTRRTEMARTATIEAAVGLNQLLARNETKN